MTWKSYLFFGLLFLAVMSLSFWGGRCSAPKSSYIEAPLPPVALNPPDTVRITRVRKIVQLDSSWREKYDSLLAAKGGQDSVAWFLIQKWTESHRWRVNQNGMLAAGDLNLSVDPVRKEVTPEQTLDTLRLPGPVIRTETVETISIPWMIAAISVGAGLGIWIGSR